MPLSKRYLTEIETRLVARGGFWHHGVAPRCVVWCRLDAPRAQACGDRIAALRNGTRRESPEDLAGKDQLAFPERLRLKRAQSPISSMFLSQSASNSVFRRLVTAAAAVLENQWFRLWNAPPH